jgi:hypothetical protein
MLQERAVGLSTLSVEHETAYKHIDQNERVSKFAKLKSRKT